MSTQCQLQTGIANKKPPFRGGFLLPAFLAGTTAHSLQIAGTANLAPYNKKPPTSHPVGGFVFLQPTLSESLGWCR
ncbi:hypothetical protein, partial [Brevundimonas sp. P7753]|uniref:hypothetical protein n=1 Tax=Brevundimonas sp. P7753 TaxID=2726982 RepID=UPI001C4B5B15